MVWVKHWGKDEGQRGCLDQTGVCVWAVGWVLWWRCRGSRVNSCKQQLATAVSIHVLLARTPAAPVLPVWFPSAELKTRVELVWGSSAVLREADQPVNAAHEEPWVNSKRKKKSSVLCFPTTHLRGGKSNNGAAFLQCPRTFSRGSTVPTVD